MKKHRRLSIPLSVLTVIAITAAAAVAASVCIAIFASVYSRALTRDAQVSAEQAAKLAEVAVDNQLAAMKARLTAVRHMAEKSSSAEDFCRQIDALTAVQEDMFAVTVYDRSGNILSTSGSGYTRKEQPYRDLSFDRTLFASAPEFAISRPHVQTLFEGVYPWVVTVAASTDSQTFGAAYIAIDFRFSELAGYIDQVGVGRRGYCYIIDSQGGIIYHPQQQVLFSGLKREEGTVLAALPDGLHTAQGVIRSIRTTADGDWRIVGVTYTDELAVERRTQIVVSVLLSFACCAVVALLVLGVYSRIVTAPVRALTRAMKGFESAADSFVYQADTAAVTELQVLSDSFAHMARRIQQLMEQVRREETALRKTELKALQAQINPHFLYNTLDSIQWMCEQGRTEDATRMVGALARLFRISISRGKELIPIRDELQHAKNYLVIQSYRYRNQFSYTFDVEDGLEEYLCNKITIQPLIENAIYHGLDRMVDAGEIRVAVRTAPDAPGDILITVADNGVGMTQEQCRRILQKERSDSSGIGVKNVNDRLKIYFGSRYGLSIQSELDVGTVVTVRIPKVQKEAEENAV